MEIQRADGFVVQTGKPEGSVSALLGPWAAEPKASLTHRDASPPTLAGSTRSGFLKPASVRAGLPGAPLHPCCLPAVRFDNGTALRASLAPPPHPHPAPWHRCSLRALRLTARCAPSLWRSWCKATRSRCTRRLWRRTGGEPGAPPCARQHAWPGFTPTAGKAAQAWAQGACKGMSSTAPGSCSRRMAAACTLREQGGQRAPLHRNPRRAKPVTGCLQPQRAPAVTASMPCAACHLPRGHPASAPCLPAPLQVPRAAGAALQRLRHHGHRARGV